MAGATPNHELGASSGEDSAESLLRMLCSVGPDDPEAVSEVLGGRESLVDAVQWDKWMKGWARRTPRAGDADEQLKCTLLCAAASRGNVNTVKILINAGASPKLRSNCMALHCAAANDHAKVVRALLASRFGQYRDLPNVSGDTALIVAAAYGSRAAARELVSGGADVRCVDASQKGVLQVAAELKQWTTVKCIVRAAQKRLAEQKGAVSTALDVSDTLSLEASTSPGLVPPIQRKLRGRSRSATSYSAGPPIVTLTTALRGSGGAALLASPVPTPNSDDPRAVFLPRCTLRHASVVYVAAQDRRPDMLEFLLEAGADPNADKPLGVSALHFAASNGDVSAARSLLKHGADANFAVGGTQPLYSAALFGHTDVVQLLVGHGADVCAKTPEGNMAVDAALRSGGMKSATYRLLDVLTRKQLMRDAAESDDSDQRLEQSREDAEEMKRCAVC